MCVQEENTRVQWTQSIVSASNLPTNQVLPVYVSTTGYEISYFFISSIIKRHGLCSDFGWFACGFVFSLYLVLSLEIILLPWVRGSLHPCPLGLLLNQTRVCSPKSTYWQQAVVKQSAAFITGHQARRPGQLVLWTPWWVSGKHL